MSNIPADLRFAESHEWARLEADGTVTVGISDHAQHEISDIVFVELPKVGQKVEAGQRCAVIESVKSASDFFAPLSGEVTEVNNEVAADPALVNRAPHAEGWLFKIKISNPSEVAALLSFADYKATL